MSDEASVKPTTLFWVVAALFLIWGLIGCGIYLMDKLMTDEAVLKFGGQVALDARQAYPIWATAAYAIAVWGGLIAAILFLMRKKFSVILFVVSLIAAVICFIPTFTDPIVKEAGGSTFWVMPLVVVSLGIFEIFYSRKQRANGILR